MKRLLPFVAVAAFAAAPAASAPAAPPPVTVEFTLTGLELLPFGGEYLLASTIAGVITDAHVRLNFTTAGTFQAQNFVFEFAGPTGGAGPLVGADLGWQGRGSFSADLHTTACNGEIQMQGDGGGLTFFFMNISPTAESLPTPVQGTLGESFVRLTVQPCTIDWNGDFRRSVQDLFDYLADYFRNSPNADTNNSGEVNVGDIFTYLQLYFAGCGGF
ncbi:MAG: hypothetical protein IT438_04965 [Phycisphaerales bacterium]|nr:hypothetical protein [Phycisphaerales bacterium]